MRGAWQIYALAVSADAPFSNPAINRSLSTEGRVAVLDDLVSQGVASCMGSVAPVESGAMSGIYYLYGRPHCSSRQLGTSACNCMAGCQRWKCEVSNDQSLNGSRTLHAYPLQGVRNGGTKQRPLATSTGGRCEQAMCVAYA